MESKPTTPFARVENALAIAVLTVMSIMPLAEIVGRKWLGGGIPGSFPIVQHLTLWIAFVGAALAARSDRLLALSTATFLPDAWRDRVQILTSGLAVGITAVLVWASFDLVRVDYEFGDEVAWGIPVWLAECIMPVCLTVVVARLIGRVSGNRWMRLLPALGLLIPVVFGLIEIPEESGLLVPALLVIVVGTALGLPIYAAIGGAGNRVATASFRQGFNRASKDSFQKGNRIRPFDLPGFFRHVEQDHFLS